MSDRVYFEADTVLVTGDGEAATLWLDRPHAQNAINLSLIRDLKKALDVLEDDGISESILVIRGKGDDFSRGIDLADFPKFEPPDIHGMGRWEKQILRLERLHRVTVAAVSGQCIGGGFQLTLACDLTLATKDATFALPEVRQGFLPGMATWRLAKFIGMGRYRALMATGRSISAGEAFDLGLAYKVGESLDALLESTLPELLPAEPTAMALARRLANESFEFSHEDAIGHFLAAQHRAITSEAFLNRLKGEEA